MKDEIENMLEEQPPGEINQEEARKERRREIPQEEMVKKVGLQEEEEEITLAQEKFNLPSPSNFSENEFISYFSKQVVRSAPFYMARERLCLFEPPQALKGTSN